MGNSEIRPLQAKNVGDLVKFIRWASTVPLKSASNPGSRPSDPSGGQQIHIPAPPPGDVAASPADVF
jgi:hypothetical protein